MKTLKDFIKENGIKMKVDCADFNKNAPDWKDANHYKITLIYHKKRLTTYFSQGYGITEEPKAEDVLNALSLDSSSIENANSFEDWCNALGYDTDSRKDEKIYKSCKKEAAELKEFLGDSLYQELLYNTESL